MIVEQSLLFDGAGGIDTYISRNDILFCLGGTKEVFLGMSHAKGCDGLEAGLRNSVLWWEMGISIHHTQKAVTEGGYGDLLGLRAKRWAGSVKRRASFLFFFLYLYTL